jgi:isoaspartyl peptidase/L-asparaginase-like protein (Ntn-hydrolase superfamily)
MGMFADTVLGAVSGAGWGEAIICSTLSIHVLYRHNETERDFKNQEFHVLVLNRGGGQFIIKHKII